LLRRLALHGAVLKGDGKAGAAQHVVAVAAPDLGALAADQCHRALRAGRDHRCGGNHLDFSTSGLDHDVDVAGGGDPQPPAAAAATDHEVTGAGIFAKALQGEVGARLQDDR
jgi:hypothetical protein